MFFKNGYLTVFIAVQCADMLIVADNDAVKGTASPKLLVLK